MPKIYQLLLCRLHRVVLAISPHHHSPTWEYCSLRLPPSYQNRIHVRELIVVRTWHGSSEYLEMLRYLFQIKWIIEIHTASCYYHSFIDREFYTVQSGILQKSISIDTMPNQSLKIQLEFCLQACLTLTSLGRQAS